MLNFKTMFFCNVGISSQSTIKNANQDPHNAVQINARNVNNVFTSFSVLLLISALPFYSTKLSIPTTCHFPSAGEYGEGGGGATLT